MGAGAFILITLLATAVNVVGMIVFLSVGLIFVARVIGLWVAMILVPLAFFSYTVPSMQGIEMIGWKHWWPETLKLAFLAPIFIFFLYLIIKFLETGLSLFQTSTETKGVTFVISIIVPFAFIMILMMKAKSIAQKMSGELGQSITGGIAAVGGLALGGAALGAAALGRKAIGGTMAKASRGDTATQKYENAKRLQGLGDSSAMNKLNAWQKLKGKAGSKIGLGSVYGKDQGNIDPKTGKALGIATGLGGLLNKKQRSVGEIDHARHEIDSMKEKAGLKGVDDKNLSGINEQKIKETYAREKKTTVESELRKTIVTGKDASGKDIVGEDGYKAANRGSVVSSIARDPANIDPTTGKLTKEAEKKVENQLNVDFNAILRTETTKKLEHDYDHLREESRQKVSPVSRIVAGSNTASYDVRNISQIKADKREGIFTKASAALIAGIAMGVRTGLKNSGINHGSGQGNFLQDLSNTITEAMKSMKVDVKVEKSHGAGGDDHGSHGGGGGHH
jgi:hypothetical protein